MVQDLFKNSRTPETPLDALRVELEAAIQLVSDSLFLYKTIVVRGVPKPITGNDLGYDGWLCNMGLVNGASAWDAFKKDIIRKVREHDKRVKHNYRIFNEKQFDDWLKKEERSYQNLLEPIARRNLIVHNLGRVDEQYVKVIPASQHQAGKRLPDVDLDYVKKTSEAFFSAAQEIVTSLVKNNRLGQEHLDTMGFFQRNPLQR
ncbi:MAG: hypothetical protein HY687_06645 [Chloroflexi bacterium]|nr:hypothetical protein [Chloroflexota bacterium]